MEPHDSPNRFITKYQESFGKIRDRIERKRQEVQGLSDGVSQTQVDRTKSRFPVADRNGYSSSPPLPSQKADWQRSRVVISDYLPW